MPKVDLPEEGPTAARLPKAPLPTPPSDDGPGAASEAMQQTQVDGDGASSRSPPKPARTQTNPIQVALKRAADSPKPPPGKKAGRIDCWVALWSVVFLAKSCLLDLGVLRMRSGFQGPPTYHGDLGPFQ